MDYVVTMKNILTYRDLGGNMIVERVLPIDG